MEKKTIRHDRANSAIVKPTGETSGIYRRCPHCGMVDLQYSAQGASKSHHQITRVGALLRYECGKCRKQFHAIELCVPAATDPIAFYEEFCRQCKESQE
jgi:ribosomal protein S27AE